MFAWHTVDTPSHIEDTYLLRGHCFAGMLGTTQGWRMNAPCMTVWNESGNKGVYDVARAVIAASVAA